MFFLWGKIVSEQVVGKAGVCPNLVGQSHSPRPLSSTSVCCHRRQAQAYKGLLQDRHTPETWALEQVRQQEPMIGRVGLSGSEPQAILYPSGCQPWGKSQCLWVRKSLDHLQQAVTVSSRWVWKREMPLIALRVHVAVLSWLQGPGSTLRTFPEGLVATFGVVGIDSWPSGTGRGPWNEGDLGHSQQPSKQAVVCSRNGSSTPGERQGACVGLACAQHPQASYEAEGACQVPSSFLDITSMPALR